MVYTLVDQDLYLLTDTFQSDAVFRVNLGKVSQWIA